MAAGLCACVLFFNIVFANGAYFKRRVVYEASSQYAFSIVEAMEKDPEYQPGVTPVAFVGSFTQSYLSRTSSEYFEVYRDLVGLRYDTAVTSDAKFVSYCGMLLGHPINLFPPGDQLTEICYRLSTLLMPEFPKEGSCQMQDGVMVVKLQNVTYPHP